MLPKQPDFQSYQPKPYADIDALHEIWSQVGNWI